MSDPLSNNDAAYRASLRRHTLNKLRYADGGAADGDDTITLDPSAIEWERRGGRPITVAPHQYQAPGWSPNQPLEAPLPEPAPAPQPASLGENLRLGLQSSAADAIHTLTGPGEAYGRGRIGGGQKLSDAMITGLGIDPQQLEQELAARSGFTNRAEQFVGGLPLNALRYGVGTLAGTAATGNPIAGAGVGSALMDTLKAAGEGQEPEEALKQGAISGGIASGLGGLGELAGPAIEQYGPQVARAIGTAATEAPGTIQDLINQLNYAGGDPERGSFSNVPRVQNAAGRNVRGTMGGAKGKTYIPLPEDVAALAQQLKPDNPNAGMRQAVSVLKWQNWDKPAAIAEYGALVRAPSTASRLQRLQNTPEAVQQHIQQAQSLFSQPTTPWTPTDYGIFDRSLIKQAMNGFPDVEQTPFPRPQAKRADLSHLDEIYLDPVNRALIKQAIARGLPLGGETFYPSLYPVKAEAIARNLKSSVFPQTGGDLFDNWIHSVAPGSARNSIYNERAVGNFLRGMTFRGLPLTDENVTREMADFKQRWGQGLPLFDTHRIGAARVLEQGISPVDAMRQGLIDEYFKIPTYSAQQTGNFAHSWTGDVHEATGETLGSRFHPYFADAGGFSGLEYGPAEQHMRNIAAEMGLPSGTGQAGRWFGGGELTGLMSPRGDSLDLYERQAAYTLHAMGQPTDPVSVRNYIMKLIQEGGDLLPWASKKEDMPDHRQMR